MQTNSAHSHEIEKWLKLIDFWSVKSGTAAINVCLNIFIRGDLPCSDERRARMVQVRDAAHERWKVIGEAAGGFDSLYWQAAMALVAQTRREGKK